VILKKSAINSITNSSIFNIGDTVQFSPVSRAIAVQRESNIWNEAYETHFEDYSLFKRKANWITSGLPVDINHEHHDSTIKVENVSITGVSQSSTVQFGGLKKINAESRIKHIRIIKDEENGEDQ
jgi:spore germination protein PE